MAGRDRYPPSSSSSLPSQLTESNRSVLLLEEKIAIQHHEIQSILTDNQKLALAHLGVKDQLNLAKRELARLLEAAAAVKSDTEAKVREVYQNSLRMEAEARVVNGIGAELDQVRSDVERLGEDREKLAAELAMLNGEIAKAKPNYDRAVEVRVEIESLREEVSKGRAALEVEKKTRASNLHHERGMEKTIDHLNREIVKLEEELADLETKAKEAAQDPSPGLVASYGNSDDIYGSQGHQFPEANGSHQVYGALDCLPLQPPNSIEHSSVP
ncbi:unnamed protein product [Eruca vesicaria subsp. sativa]|uniref:Protein FLC EXPRESSOR n=1 Tax=Eruca vesicaria subsp. sativa TaxID=29727 RepID=A0ABC8JBJ2_ERUVS|nr:unnamed protein product [Eruca vesicaria subsp. sativa]